MSLLQNIITQVAQNALTGGQSQQNSGLGGMLGQVVASQLGGGQSQAQGGLGGVLGSLLGGGQTRQNVPASDLGSVLGQVLGSQSANKKAGLTKTPTPCSYPHRAGLYPKKWRSVRRACQIPRQRTGQ